MTAPARRGADAVRRGAAGVRWYVTSLMGDTAYARYCAHLRRDHADAPVPTEREYWRARHAAADAHPGARCC